MSDKIPYKSEVERIKERNVVYYSVEKHQMFQGIKDCVFNARTLLNSGEKICEGKIGYGAANSLLILAAEECVKAHVLFAVYFDVDLEFAIEPYFSKHYVTCDREGDHWDDKHRGGGHESVCQERTD
jgi:hypothetical protein